MLQFLPQSLQLLHSGPLNIVCCSFVLWLFQVACWLLDPSSEERTLTNMVTAFCPQELPLLDGLGSLHTHCPRVRAATTSVLVHAVMSHVTGLLEEDGALSTDTQQTELTREYSPLSALTLHVSFHLEFFRSVEMPSQVCLALLELNGMGFSVEECERQKHVMQAKLSELESKAYILAGRSFSLTSVDDVAQVRPKDFPTDFF